MRKCRTGKKRLYHALLEGWRRRGKEVIGGSETRKGELRKECFAKNGRQSKENLREDYQKTGHRGMKKRGRGVDWETTSDNLYVMAEKK